LTSWDWLSVLNLTLQARAVASLGKQADSATKKVESLQPHAAKLSTALEEAQSTAAELTKYSQLTFIGYKFPLEFSPFCSFCSVCPSNVLA
jgi:hypothetical protein